MTSKNIFERIEDSYSICFLTGAGVSTLSGIPDFVSTDNVWKYDIPRTDAISLRFFKKNPQIFWKIYRELFTAKQDAKPNALHQWIAELESDKEISVVTQNVDGLHELAGSSKVHSIHGNTKLNVCLNDACLLTSIKDDLAVVPECPSCGKILKPDVVLFDEELKGFETALQAAIDAQMLIVMGTSLTVSPVNMIPSLRDFEKNEALRRFHVESKEHAEIFNNYTQAWVNGTNPPNLYYEFDNKWRGQFEDFLQKVK